MRCEYRLFAAHPEMASGIDFGLAQLLEHRRGRSDTELLRHRPHHLSSSGVVRTGLGDQVHGPPHVSRVNDG